MARTKYFVGGVEVFMVSVSTPSMSYRGFVRREVMDAVHDLIVDKLFAKPEQKFEKPVEKKPKAARTKKRRSP